MPGSALSLWPHHLQRTLVVAALADVDHAVVGRGGDGRRHMDGGGVHHGGVVEAGVGVEVDIGAGVGGVCISSLYFSKSEIP